MPCGYGLILPADRVVLKVVRFTGVSCHGVLGLAPRPCGSRLRPLLTTTSSGSQPTMPLPREATKATSSGQNSSGAHRVGFSLCGVNIPTLVFVGVELHGQSCPNLNTLPERISEMPNLELACLVFSLT